MEKANNNSNIRTRQMKLKLMIQKKTVRKQKSNLNVSEYLFFLPSLNSINELYINNEWISHIPVIDNAYLFLWMLLLFHYHYPLPTQQTQINIARTGGIW